MAIIDCLPAPLLQDIVQGRCVPIIGAGFSRNAILPHGLSMPLWGDLGRLIGAQVPDFPRDEANPVEAISAYQHEFGRPRLVEELRQLLHHGVARPGPPHIEFCRLPFNVVCTTNADCLLERGYEAVSVDYYVIVEEQQLSIGVDPRTVTLLKFHGDLNHPNRLVAAESDYARFAASNPLMITYLANLLITRTPLFIGYSLDDPDFRQILEVISDRLGSLRRQAYVLTHRASRYQRSRYERRNVRCIELA